MGAGEGMAIVSLVMGMRRSSTSHEVGPVSWGITTILTPRVNESTHGAEGTP